MLNKKENDINEVNLLIYSCIQQIHSKLFLCVGHIGNADLASNKTKFFMFMEFIS